MSDHYSVDFVQDHQGWWQGRCNCGRDLGVFPDPEDACDALMDHAFRAGYESRGYLPLPPETSNPATTLGMGEITQSYDSSPASEPTPLQRAYGGKVRAVSTDASNQDRDQS